MPKNPKPAYVIAEATNPITRDINKNCARKVGQCMADALQLLDEPSERASLCLAAAMGVFDIAVDAAMVSYQKQIGEDPRRDVVVVALIERLLQNQKISFEIRPGKPQA